MSVYSPDLTGLDPENYFSTYQRTIFKYAQKILFEVPVFQNEKLEIIKLGVINEKLTYGVDYIVQDNDIDYDAMSVCKNIDPTFSATLIKSLTILGFTNVIFQIQAKFNQLFSDSINYAAINQAHEIEVTPILIANMVAQLEYLQQVATHNSATYSPQSSLVKIALNEYPNGDNDDNVITDEPHDLNTLTGECFIRPIYGSFFKDSVSIKIKLSGQQLVVDQDYVILELDVSRTKTTSNVSGVYCIIKVLKQIVGEVDVTYRAYGGTADVASMRFVQNRIEVIEAFLSKTSYITPKTISADPTIIGITNKIQELEGTMRLLLQNGLPSYGDVSTGKALLKRIVSQDTDLHWWSIASLYRVSGSADDVLADVFKFRLSSLVSKLMFECSVSVNVNTDAAHRITVTCDNSNIPNDTLAKFTPKLRIIEVSAGGVFSGVMLQLGMRLGTGILQETFDVEDMSGRESCWKLIPTSAESTPPEDTAVLMPNGSSIFSFGSASALVDEVTIPFKGGLNILNTLANIPLNISAINANAIATENFNLVVQNVDDIDLKDVKSFELSLIVNIGDTQAYPITVNIPIEVKDVSNKYWSGYSQINTSDGSYNVFVRLSYSATDSAYKIGYLVNSSNLINTLNIVATKLMF